MKIIPTVGRVLHFWPGSEFKHARPNKGEPLPAIIAAVHGEDSLGNAVITVGGLDADGNRFNARHVPLVVDAGSLLSSIALPPNGWCTWMPYQIGQAPASSAIERRLQRLEDAVAGGALKLAIAPTRFERTAEKLTNVGGGVQGSPDEANQQEGLKITAAARAAGPEEHY